ncbi:MAG: glycosyltransferase [Blautia sp.]|nr:glycosyltransferase [Blautia sp.]
MAAKISIIIPVYNAEQYLSHTLDTILGQSLKEIEVICVDDGSTDSSRDIVRQYAQKDKRVILRCQENRFAGAARNNGLEIATGEYLHFMDADDYVLDYAYEAIYAKAKKYDLDCLKFCAVAFDEGIGTTTKHSTYSLDKLRVGDFNRILPIATDSPRYELGFTPWSGIYRRSFLMEHNVRFNHLFCVNDRSFSVRMFTIAPRVMASRDILVVHRINNSQSLVGKRAEHYDCQIESVRIIEKQLLEDQVPTELFERTLQRELKDLLFWCRTYAGDKKYGRKILADTEEFLYSWDYRFMREFRKMLRDIQEKKSIEEEQESEKEEESETKEEGETKGETEIGKVSQINGLTVRPIEFFMEECPSVKVSVIVPVYNQEEYLNQALHSLKRQSLKEMEFICVNDGSTDASMAILKEYANVDKRFRIIDKENTGYGNSMNVGLDAARGEYIGILEPDDFVPMDMYRKLYAIASKEKLEIVKADFYRFRVEDDGSTVKKVFRLSSDPTYYNRLVNPSEDVNAFQLTMNTWSGIYQRSFLNKWKIRHNETPGASYQDNGFWFQTFCRCERAWFVPAAYYLNRRDNPNSSMFDRGKFSAITREYQFIWDFLSQDRVLLSRFEGIYFSKKFSNSIIAYYRLAPELKREYLHHICEEFREPMEQGKLKEELFEPKWWKMLMDILKDPDAFYDKLRVSVIIPAYNVSSYIRSCLDSILARDAIRMEVICVDDGSTDDTYQILQEYEKKDSRVRAVTQANAGAGAARNNGMKLAKGQYLAFLDADDFFDADMIRRSYEQAYLEEADMVVFRSDQYIEALHTYKSAEYTIKKDLLPKKQVFAGEEIEDNIFNAFMGWPWDKLFRADFVRENGLYFQEQRTTNDMLFVFSALVKAERITVSDLVLAHHRRLDAGESLSVSRESSWRCFYDALTALKDQLIAWGKYERYKKDFVNYALHFSLWNLNTLKGKAYYNLYEKLKEEWFRELDILDMKELDFYSPDNYSLLQAVLTMEAEEYLFFRLDGANNRAALLPDKDREIRSLKNQLESSKKREAALKRQLNSINRSSTYKFSKVVGAPVWMLQGLLKKKK